MCHHQRLTEDVVNHFCFSIGSIGNSKNLISIFCDPSDRIWVWKCAGDFFRPSWQQLPWKWQKHNFQCVKNSISQVWGALCCSFLRNLSNSDVSHLKYFCFSKKFPNKARIYQSCISIATRHMLKCLWFSEKWQYCGLDRNENWASPLVYLFFTKRLWL